MPRLLPLLLALGGCSADKATDTATDGSSATEADVVAACESYCDTMKDGAGCDAAAVEVLCYDLCVTNAALYQACPDDAVAVYDCMLTEPHVCDGSFMWDGVDYPLPEDIMACNNEFNRLCY